MDAETTRRKAGRSQRARDEIDAWWPHVTRIVGLAGMSWELVIDKLAHVEFFWAFLGLAFGDRVIEAQRRRNRERIEQENEG